MNMKLINYLKKILIGKNKIIDKFINKIRVTYNDIKYLIHIINAYLNPV